MKRKALSLREDYWETFEITETDINYLYNYLIELERPTALGELVRALIGERIEQIKKAYEKRRSEDNRIFLPKDIYEVGETVVFPVFDWTKATVTNRRPGLNPEVSAFDVIDVEFEDGTKRSFASNLQEHVLNEPMQFEDESSITNPDAVMTEYGDAIAAKLQAEISGNPGLITIADKWFPKALLVDVNIGYLNLAEALLDMEGGGPLTTEQILKQIDLPTDVSRELTAFSLNYALHVDERFDEVGATGEIVWFLHRLEPEWVQNQPIYLQHQPVPYDEQAIQDLKGSLSRQVIDELEVLQTNINGSDEVTLSLIYPHWRSGSLPLAKEFAYLFPTAIESPRVRFTFVDSNSGASFSGWVVRKFNYIGGLTEWYRSQGIIPGSLIHLQRGRNEGEVNIRVDRRRSAREWVRTALVGADGGIVFAMLKQLVSTVDDERMTIYIPDTEAMNSYWVSARAGKYELTRIIIHMMRELIKLNPQGHVHLEELYAAVNLRYRCPPGLILSILMENAWASHLGDLYFNLNREHLEKSK